MVLSYPSTFLKENPLPFRCTTLLPEFALQRFIDHYHKYPGRLEWDKVTLQPSSRELESIEANVSVDLSITHAALGGAISARSFIDLRNYEFGDDDSLTVWGGSITYNKIKPNKAYVRGWNYSCGSKLQKVGDKIRITDIWHADLKGWLPHSILDKAMPGSMVTVMKSLHDVLPEKDAIRTSS
eukprot:TRINITY_DN8014_c0_g1_i1.p1 TRINITY_DN8014_c0_g1~~TRINITY_DN8014_c0_g1_i1.p1  ORF type:complete len:183 (+),score=28.65 TRINITY_DN8014_c0_g1_i1:121-669(+)